MDEYNQVRGFNNTGQYEAQPLSGYFGGGTPFGGNQNSFYSPSAGTSYGLNPGTSSTNINYNGTNFNIDNPGTIDLSRTNPALYNEIMNLNGLRDQFNASSMNALDPAKYAARRADSLMQGESRLNNQFAQYGLGGSSAALGAQMENTRQTNFAWDDRQLNDLMKSISVQSGLSGQISKDTLAGQAMYGQYQSGVNNTILGLTDAEARKQASDNQMWGSIIQGAGTLAGLALAPATGGLSLFASAGLGASMGSGADGLTMPEIGSQYGSSSYAPGYYNF